MTSSIEKARAARMAKLYDPIKGVEHRAKIGEQFKKNWQDEDCRKRIIEGHKKTYTNGGFERWSNASKKKWEDPEYRRKTIEAQQKHRDAYWTPERRAKKARETAERNKRNGGLGQKGLSLGITSIKERDNKDFESIFEV